MQQPRIRCLERRGDWRYRFDRDLHFCVERQGVKWRGTGQSIELAAGGLLFDADCPLTDGEDVEIQMDWPMLAQGVCPVVLLIDGTIVRTDARGTALRMRNYQFQIAGASGLDSPIGNGAVCNLVA